MAKRVKVTYPININKGSQDMLTKQETTDYVVEKLTLCCAFPLETSI